tara:strand:+ start:2150 stop:4771 length:2622 start_codon:yes stop_codon:yes gene_type:complete
MGGFNPFKSAGKMLANAAMAFVMSGGNWFAVAASIASTMFQQAIAPKPTVPNFSGNFDVQAQQDRVLSFRNAVTTRKLVYGEIKVGGPIVFISTTNNGSVTNGFLHMVVLHASHKIQSFEGWYINGREIPLSSVSGGASGGDVNAGDYSGLVRINPHLGDYNQPADSDLVSECDEWSSEHTLSNMAYTYFRFKFDAKKFQGSPDVAAKVKGKLVYDTRTGATGYSSNPALVLRDYMITTFGMNLDEALIDDTRVSAAANICDEDVTLVEAGTENRFECHGMVDTANKVSSNLEELLTSMAGSLIYSNGKFKISAGAGVTPIYSFAEKDITGPVNITPRMSRRENFNAVKGKYISEINDWQSSDYPPIESSVFKAEDNGETIFRDFTLPYTTSSSMAQRISKIALYVNRQPLMFSATFSLAALGMDVGDVCYVSNDRYGWEDKQFQLLSWNFVVAGDELSIQMELKEYSVNSYSWETSEEEVLTATPNTVIPNVFDINPPTNIAITEEMRETRDSRGVQSVLVTTFDSSNDSFVFQYEAEYKKSTDSVYTSVGTSSAQKFEILDVAAAVYDIRIRAITSLGSTSDFVTAQFSADGLTAAPSAMSGLTVNQVGGMAFLQWGQTTDLDVKIGGKVEVRFQPVQSGASLMDSLAMDDSIAGSSTSAMVPLLAGTYLLRFIDSSGNTQSSPTSIVSQGATILSFTTASTITESPSFGGTKTNLMVTDANELQLASSVLLDSVADFDALSDFDLLGAIDTTGTYVFASNMDLTSVKRVRLSETLVSNIFNALDNFDDRSANIDTWEDFDGTEAAVGDIDMYFAVTDDDPASGGASWSAYKPFTQSEEQGRGFKFKAVFTTTDVAYNVKCTGMTVTAATI